MPKSKGGFLMKKKFFALCLALILCLGIFPVTAFAAEPQLISRVEFTVPDAVAGNAADIFSYADPEGRFTVTGEWSIRTDYNAYATMDPAAVFESNNFYYLDLELVANTGYEFDTDNCEFYLNGEEIYCACDPTEAFCSYYATTCNLSEAVTEIVIPESALPQPELGEEFRDEDFKIYETEDYTVKGYWEYVDINGNWCNEGTFEKGNEYSLYIQVNVKEGKCFAEEVSTYLGDEEPSSYSTNYADLNLYKDYSFKEKLDSVVLPELPEAKTGDKLKEVFEVKVPEGAKYTAVAHWYIYNTETGIYNCVSEAEGTDIVKDGFKYNLMVDIYPKYGCEFAEEITVNAYGVDHEVWANANYATFDRNFSFTKVIDKVEILGYKEPAIGDTPDVSAIKVPEDANYLLNYVEWADVTETSFESFTEFEDGRMYVLIVSLSPKSGYEFDSVVEYTIGSETDKLDSYVEGMEIFTLFSTLENISEVKLSSLPEMKVGETASNKVTVPEGAKYTAEASWYVWNEEERYYEPFEGKFEEGKVYERAIVINAEKGYGITKDSKVYADGVLREDAYYYHIGAEFFDYFYTKQKEIVSVEIEIEAPKAGAHASNRPVITLITKEGVEIVEEFSSWYEGNYEDSCYIYNEYFDANGNYGVDFYLIAKEGYAFAKDAKVIVNGKTIPADEINNTAKEINAKFFFNENYEEEENDNPNTADTMNLSVLFAVSMLALAGAAVLIKRRKTN